MAILEFIHLQEQFKMLPIKIPIYIICLVVLGVIYFFYKKTLLQVATLGARWNIGLFCLQFLLILIYAKEQPSLSI